ncbi:transmembrane signal receptor [Lithospermum erythrorhizon]|uniref:Transmembrane signal receptor n=1 Tax=Lithospermum erythrorhizon TaxID=34254 RepID=A0AAV3RM61_LITER
MRLCRRRSLCWTWTMVELPKGKKALGTQWVYKVKYKFDGTIERFKARLVVFGNHQVEGIDYNDTFSSVAKMVTVRVFLAMAAVKQCELHQMNVHNAFLHGDLSEEVYMKLPPRFYKSFGSDLGVLKYFLGVEVARSHEEIFLCQRKYTLDIIYETGLMGAKPVSFPMEPNQRLASSTSALLRDVERYRPLVGRLIDLSFTRPDLTFAVHVLSQFLYEPRQDHWLAELRVVSCPIMRRSVSGWIVFIGSSPISWKTKKQVTVARSSAEAKYRSMASVTCELKWLKDDIFTNALGSKQFEFLLRKLGTLDLHVPT